MIETFAVNKPRSTWWVWVIGIGALALLATWLLWQQTLPPHNFPKDKAVVISRGLSASAIADFLKEEGVVKSSTILYISLVLYHDPASIQAGTYIFSEPLSVFAVADKITESPGANNLATLTLPEGFTVREFATLAENVLPDFDRERFVELARDREGYLFPDTYYLPTDFTEEELFSLLISTYQEKTEGIKDQITVHALSEYEVLILASLLEREANSEESMRIVSGILQNRLNTGMPLQADASIEYVLDRPLGELTPEDLEIDSPYNTYLNRGLPPTPIGNPGMTSIMAVLNPIGSDYFYYLTDEEGNFHYAETFDEHRENIQNYLQ